MASSRAATSTQVIPMEDHYFVRQGARVTGPFSAEAVKKLATGGGLDPNDELSRDARSWSMASSVPGLRFGGATSIDRPYYVFISYSSENKREADIVCATLEAAGIPCWIAPRDILPGAEIAEGINEGIDQSRIVVLVFSEHANNSSAVRRQIERATSNHRKVIPFRVQNVRPARSLEFHLSNTQWFDAFDSPIEKRAEELVTVVRRVVRKESIVGGPPSNRTDTPIKLAPLKDGRGPVDVTPASRTNASAKLDLLAGQLPPWLKRGRPVLGLSLGIAILAVVVVGTVAFSQFRSSVGTIVVNVSEPGANIAIDTDRANVSWSADKKVAEIQAPAGKYRLQASKVGFVATDFDVEVHKGAREIIIVPMRRAGQSSAPLNPPNKSPKYVWARPPSTNSKNRDTRTRWVGDGGKQFVKTGRVWAEQGRSREQQFVYDEIERTQSYVEIRRRGTELHLRLFDSYMQFKANDGRWQRVESGKRHPKLLPTHGSWQ